MKVLMKVKNEVHSFFNFLDAERFLEGYKGDVKGGFDETLYRDVEDEEVPGEAIVHPPGLTERTFSVLKIIGEKRGRWTVTGSRSFGAASFLEENGLVSSAKDADEWVHYMITEAGKMRLSQLS